MTKPTETFPTEFSHESFVTQPQQYTAYKKGANFEKALQENPPNCTSPACTNKNQRSIEGSRNFVMTQVSGRSGPFLHIVTV